MGGEGWEPSGNIWGTVGSTGHSRGEDGRGWGASLEGLTGDRCPGKGWGVGCGTLLFLLHQGTGYSALPWDQRGCPRRWRIWENGEAGLSQSCFCLHELGDSQQAT